MQGRFRRVNYSAWTYPEVVPFLEAARRLFECVIVRRMYALEMISAGAPHDEGRVPKF